MRSLTITSECKSCITRRTLIQWGAVQEESDLADVIIVTTVDRTGLDQNYVTTNKGCLC